MSHEFITRPSGCVESFTGYVEHGEPVARFEEPLADPVLIVSLGPSIDVIDAAGRRATLRSFVGGLGETPSVTEHDGEQAGIQVRLGPFAARALLGMPIGELANVVVDLDDVLGHAAAELSERLAATDGWDARFDILEAHFARRMADAAPPPRDVEWAWGRLRASGGRVRVDALARELGWSRRHFAERFRAEIGLAPKAVARLMRFERVARRLRAGGDHRLGEVALDCGYYDQAHLNRDFRQFAGCTPGEFAARRMPAGDGIAAPDGVLPFVQDAAAALA
jgi:AraC-like DNA-binding protein